MNKKITWALWGILILAIVGVGVAQFVLPRHRAGSSEVSELRDLFPAAQFSLTDQEGRTITTRDLHGHAWIADFIFTSCGGTCPIMSHKMAQLQQETPASVKLVSFTVDPEHDTPTVLKEYATPLKADPGRWHFLTGTPKEMADAAYGMKISVRPASENKVEGILHSTHFLLVNGAGMVVGVYDSTSDDSMKQLVADATRLAGEKPS